MLLNRPLEFQILNEPLEGEPTPVVIESLNDRNVVKLAFFRQLVIDLFNEPPVLMPSELDNEVLDAQKDLVAAQNRRKKERSLYSDQDSRSQERLDYWLTKVAVNHKKIDAAKNYLLTIHPNDKDLMNADDEKVITDFNLVILDQCNKVTESLLSGDNEASTNLREIQSMLEILAPTPHGLVDEYESEYKIRSAINKVKVVLGEDNDEIYGLPKTPNLGNGFLSFVKESCPELNFDEVADSSLVFIESIGTFGTSKQIDGKKVLRLVLEPARHFTGLGGGNPTVEIENVTGNVRLVEYAQEIPSDRAQNRQLAEAVFKKLSDRGIKQVKTHVFDSVYLFDALMTGKWTLPSLKGFQVETKDLTGQMPKFRYFQPDMPFFAFIFDGDALEEQYPSNKRENIVSGYHFIPGGMEYSNPAFLHCLVTPKFKEGILQWVRSLGKEDMRKMFGDKDPEKFFVSSTEDLE